MSSKFLSKIQQHNVFIRESLVQKNIKSFEKTLKINPSTNCFFFVNLLEINQKSVSKVS